MSNSQATQSQQNDKEHDPQHSMQIQDIVGEPSTAFHENSEILTTKDSQLRSPVKKSFSIGNHIRQDNSDHLKSPLTNSEQRTRSSISNQYQDEFYTGSEGDSHLQLSSLPHIAFEKSYIDSVIGEQERSSNEDSQEEGQSNYEGKSQEADDGENCGGTNYFLECLRAKMEDIPSIHRLSGCQAELDRQVKSLNDLPSNTTKGYFMLGEKTPHNYADLDFGDGIDEVDEINEDLHQDKSNNEDNNNHRSKASINPIYLCQEMRLQFRVDSLNTNDENTQSGQAEDSDDSLVKTVENLKKSHQKLKEQKLMRSLNYHKSCINL